MVLTPKFFRSSIGGTRSLYLIIDVVTQLQQLKVDGPPKVSPAGPLCRLFPNQAVSPPDHPSQAQIREPFLFPKCPILQNENKTQIYPPEGKEREVLLTRLTSH
jgi:hypothetical protein